MYGTQAGTGNPKPRRVNRVLVEPQGELHVIVGPMFSGKTTELLSRLGVAAATGLKAVYINSTKDERVTASSASATPSASPGAATTVQQQAADVVNTHNQLYSGSTNVQNLDRRKVRALSDMDVSPYDVIGIDEAHFYPDLLRVASAWFTEQHKIVHVCGLDGDVNRKPIGEILQLVPFSTSTVKVNAFCIQCIQEARALNARPPHVEAPFTVAKIQLASAIHPGGAETYDAVCARHYNDHALKAPTGTTPRAGAT